MPRELVPLEIRDLSGFARSLARELGDAAPSHQSLLNMLARAGGYRNHQHLRAVPVQDPTVAALSAPPEPEIDHARLKRALNHFDDRGRLTRWPTRNAVQKLVVWAFWADLPVDEEELSEAEVNERFLAGLTFDDPATIRRMLVGLGRVRREPDGSAYIRVDETPPRDAAILIGEVRQRRLPSRP